MLTCGLPVYDGANFFDLLHALYNAMLLLIVISLLIPGVKAPWQNVPNPMQDVQPEVPAALWPTIFGNAPTRISNPVSLHWEKQ